MIRRREIDGEREGRGGKKRRFRAVNDLKAVIHIPRRRCYGCYFECKLDS